MPQAAERLIARTVIVAAGAGGRHLVPAAGVRSHAYRDRYLMADVPGPSVESAEVAAVTLDAAGVLESFPLPGGGRRLVAWDAASDRGSAPLDDTDAAAVDRLRRAVADRTGDDALAARIERVTGFGIRRAVAHRLRLGRVFVVGDAAHEVSPIGGQGMNLGLLDVATLAPLIARWLPQVESSDELARWERQRLASARTAVRLAAANTALGRPRSALAHRVVTGALAGALSGPFGPMLARAYAMGLDRDGRIGSGRTAHGLTG
ncbi:FAD-dependent monooxygenase [Microbacterium elymi]|nr:FAD-dependent monooxygenase [Microbacterium elymi]